MLSNKTWFCSAFSIQHDPPGYYWREHHDKDMLSLVEETYGPVEKGSNAVTFAGTQYFRYKSLKPGITYITLTQLRLSESDIALEEMFKVNIKSTGSSEAQNTPRNLINSEKIRVTEIAQVSHTAPNSITKEALKS